MLTDREPKAQSKSDVERELAFKLGPALPLSIFTSSERWHPERIGALAVYCSDGRWGEAFDEFCHKHLNIPRYDRWAVPGGPASLLLHENDGPAVEYVRGQVDFLVREHGLQQLVLIAHYGCAYYTLHLQCEPDDCLPHQMDDLRRLAPLLRQWYPNLRVAAFLAMRSGNALSFHQVDV